MEQLKIFQNPEFGAIRTMSDERGEPLFCAKDVAEALGYSNGRDAVRKHVEGEDKITVAICDTGSNYKTNAVFINESGLYALILSSKLKNGFLYELYSFVERMFVDNKMPITECYIDHRKGYIHIAYNPDRYSMWPFISNQFFLSNFNPLCIF